jgi:pectinesterase
VAFIFGYATTVFQKYTLVARKPSMTLMAHKPIKGQQNTVNAHGWEHATKTTGFMFQFCNVVARDDLVHANFPVETYLGRLRKVHAHVVFMECDLQSLVDPK